MEHFSWEGSTSEVPEDEASKITGLHVQVQCQAQNLRKAS